jgi:uncharacterized protein
VDEGVVRVRLSAMVGVGFWVVERSGSRVFVLGEMVGLREGDLWLTDEIRAAVAGSRELWREADRESLERSPLLAAHVLSDEPLSERLDESRREALDVVARRVGVDPGSLEALRPWAAGQVLEQAWRAGAGIDAGLGVDAVIVRLAAEAGIPVRFELGDAPATLSWFSGMDREVEVDYLMWTIERVAAGHDENDRLVQAWLRGDPRVADEQDREMREAHPALHERLLVERNRAWIPRIGAMLDGPGSAFVLVGGAHLAGDHNILDLLTQAGLRPTPVT